MNAKELADGIYEGFKTALTCPDVCPSEYKQVMERAIKAAIVAAEKAMRTRAATLVLDELSEDVGADIAESIMALPIEE